MHLDHCLIILCLGTIFLAERVEGLKCWACMASSDETESSCWSETTLNVNQIDVEVVECKAKPWQTAVCHAATTADNGIQNFIFRSCGVLKDFERLGCTKHKSEKNERSSQMCACDTDLCNRYTPDPKNQDNVYGPVRNKCNKLYSTSASLIAMTLFILCILSI